MTLTQDDPVDLNTLEGPMRTYVYRPAAPGKYPGLVLWSEIFNVTDPIRRTAMTMAGHGFIVVVPEVYHEFEPAGKVLAYDQAGAERGNFLKTEKELSSYDSDAEAAVDFLEKHPLSTGKVGSMGMCLGGHLSMRCAKNPRVSAAVCLYATDIHQRSLGRGKNDNTLDLIPEIKAELLLIWGRQDPHVPSEGRAKIYEALAKGNCDFQWHEFNGAHAFIRDEGTRYDPVLARESYGLAVELFKRKLV